MNKTNIGWTDYSSNLIKYRDLEGNVVNACVKASEGCRHCYAETLAPRWGRKGKPFTAENMKRLTPFFDDKEARVVLGSKKLSGKRLFHGDMTDWMGPWASDLIIQQCLAYFAAREDVVFQTLTKHADRQLAFFTEYQKKFYWPLPNVHVGVSAENQEWFEKRWGNLRRTPAAVRFLSLEPLLDRIDPQSQMFEDLGEFIWPDWTIIGGESGGGHRPIELEPLLQTIKDFRVVSPVFVKQDSGSRPGMQGRIPNELWLKEFPK